MNTTHAAYTAPAKKFSADGRHAGPGPWLSLLHVANDMRPDAFGQPLSSATVREEGGALRWVETYTDYTVSWEVDATGDAASDVTVAALTADAGALLDLAAATVEGVTRVTRTATCRHCGTAIEPTAPTDPAQWRAVGQPDTVAHLCRESPASILYHRPYEPTTDDAGPLNARLREIATRPHVEPADEPEPTPERTLHLGIVAHDRTWVPETPRGFRCHITEDLMVTVEPGRDSFKVWGNVDDPSEDHTDDGTRHIEIDFAEGIVPADWNDERDWGLAIHAHLSNYLAANAHGWRPVDYVVWTSRENHSADVRTDVAL